MSCSHTLKDWCGQGCHLYNRRSIGIPSNDNVLPLDKTKNKENIMTFPVKPLADRVIVKVLDNDNELTTKSGLVLPKSMSAKFKTAKVMAVGQGVVMGGQLVPLEVSVGDLVQLTAHVGDEMAVDGEKYLLVTERVIVAILGGGDHSDDKKCCNGDTSCKRKVVKSQLLTETDIKK